MRDTGARPSDLARRRVVCRDRVIDVDNETGLIARVLARDTSDRAGTAGA